MMTLTIKRYKLIEDKIVTTRDVIFDVRYIQINDEEIFLYDEFGQLMNSKEEEKLFTYNCDYSIYCD